MRVAADVHRILIVGAGGFGREVLLWAREAWPMDAGRIGGFHAADPHGLEGHATTLRVIGHPDTFQFAQGDACLLAIGIPGVRRQVADKILARGVNFLTLVHPAAIVAPTASIGAGSIVCPYAIVSDSARLGRCALMNFHSSLGHDAAAGDFAVLSPYATLGGGACIESDVFLGLHASVGPGKRVGPRSKLAANSAALADVPADHLAFGVPGRVSPLMT
ncbi:MAG: hypothetical protein ACK6CT_15380 [Planctomycetia bacterium]